MQLHDVPKHWLVWETEEFSLSPAKIGGLASKLGTGTALQCLGGTSPSSPLSESTWRQQVGRVAC